MRDARDAEVTMGIEWLRKHALFGCHGCHVCREDYSWPASDLRWMPNGKDLVCWNCYDDVAEIPEDEDEEPIGFSDLREFDPFAAAIEQARREGCCDPVSSKPCGCRTAGMREAFEEAAGIARIWLKHGEVTGRDGMFELAAAISSRGKRAALRARAKGEE